MRLQRILRFLLVIAIALICAASMPGMAASATVSWVVDSDGDWGDGANWSTGSPPGILDDVVIDRPNGDFTISISAGTQLAASVLCTETLQITGGSLQVGSSLQADGGLRMAGGRLIGATALSPVTCQGTGVRLEGVTIESELHLGLSGLTYVYVENGLTLNGAAYLGAGAHDGRINFNGAQTLTGNGEVVLGTRPLSGLYALAGPLTVGPEILIHGHSGTVSGGGVGLVNQGTIRASVSGGNVKVTGNLWTNQGLLEAVDGGKLVMDGTRSTSDLGTFRGLTGVVELRGILDNTGHAFDLDASTGSLQLVNCTIEGGSLAPTTGGAEFLFTGTGNRLDGVTVDADLRLGVLGLTYLYVDDVLTLNGTMSIGGGSYDARLNFNGTQTLVGTGEIVLGSRPLSGVYALAGPLTLSSGVLIHGQSGTVSGGTVGLLIQGTIRADTPGGTVTIAGSSWTNHGLLEAVNGGKVVMDGMRSTADLGDFRGVTGTVELRGTLDNSGEALVLDATTGSLQLYNCRVMGGTLATPSGGAEFVLDGGGNILEAVTVDADLRLGVLSLTSVNVEGGLTLNGTAWLGTQGYDGRINFSGAQSLVGTGEVVLGTRPASGLYALGGPLTLSPGILVRGHSGTVSGGVAGLVIQGTVRAEGSGGAVVVTGNGWANQGLIEAVNGGTVRMEGSVTTPDLGDFRGVTGTVELRGTLQNGGHSLGLNSTTGSLVLYNATIVGGSLAPCSGGAEFVLSGGGNLLQGLTVDGDLRLGLVNLNYVRAEGGLTVNGSVSIGTESYDGRISFDGPQTIGGTGEIRLGSRPTSGLYSLGGALTIGPGLLVHGHSGTVSAGTDDLEIQGSVRAVTAGGTIVLGGASVNSAGLLEAASGAKVQCNGPLSSSGQITVRTSGRFTTVHPLTQTAGTTSVEDQAVLEAGNGLVLTGGALAGAGSVVGAVTNGGTIAPGGAPGHLLIDGSYEQTAAGTLHLEVSGSDPALHDQLVVTGSAALSGIVDVDWIGGFIPKSGDAFLVVQPVARVGAFSTEMVEELPDGLVLTADYADTPVVLRTVGSSLQPVIDQISDVLDDQGGQINLEWLASALDSDAAPDPVVEYEVQRFSSAWEPLLTVTASRSSRYSATVSTEDVLVLDTPAPWSHYRVLARTATPGVTYASAVDSGYSIDNLPPSPPTLTLSETASGRELSWTLPPETDLSETCIFRSSTPGWSADTPLTCTTGSSWVDAEQSESYYFVRAIDVHGNQSEPSNEIASDSATGAPVVPLGPALLQNRPNPFNPRTTIEFVLSSSQHVRLDVFDLRGRRITTLADAPRPAGASVVHWDGRDAAGRSVASGVYVYRLEGAGWRLERRMVLVE